MADELTRPPVNRAVMISGRRNGNVRTLTILPISLFKHDSPLRCKGGCGILAQLEEVGGLIVHVGAPASSCASSLALGELTIVCADKMSLADTQHCIASDWVQCWEQHVVPGHRVEWAS
jgi:hypothetical protein